jgi:hypothetical protein
MSAEEQGGLMESPENAANTLALEAQRYLAAVDAFRAEGYEPNWRPETWLERVWLSRSWPAFQLDSDDGRNKCSS